jgi:hypothetical protein
VFAPELRECCLKRLSRLLRCHVSPEASPDFKPVSIRVEQYGSVGSGRKRCPNIGKDAGFETAEPGLGNTDDLELLAG